MWVWPPVSMLKVGSLMNINVESGCLTGRSVAVCASFTPYMKTLHIFAYIHVKEKRMPCTLSLLVPPLILSWVLPWSAGAGGIYLPGGGGDSVSAMFWTVRIFNTLVHRAQPDCEIGSTALIPFRTHQHILTRYLLCPFDQSEHITAACS